MQIRIQIPKRRGRYGHLQIFWHNCSSSFFFLFFFCCKGQVFLDIQKRKVDKQFFKKGELLIQTSMSGENWEKQTNLKTSIDCIKLPNWLKTGSLPSFWIPKYSAIECKSWHFGMESRESIFESLHHWCATPKPEFHYIQDPPGELYYCSPSTWPPSMFQNACRSKSNCQEKDRADEESQTL